MKKLILIITVAATMIFGCKKNSSSTDATTTSSSVSPTASIIVQEKWRIATFTDNGRDETLPFSGYKFSFAANGGANAVKGASIINGNWTVGSSSGGETLILNFGTVAPFSELKNDWHVQWVSSDSINLNKFTTVNGVDTLYLNFKRF